MKLKMAPNSGFAILLRSPWWVSFAIAAAINSNGACRNKIRKTMYLLIDLHGKFTGWNNYNGIDTRVFFAYQFIKNRQYKCSSFSGSCV